MFLHFFSRRPLSYQIAQDACAFADFHAVRGKIFFHFAFFFHIIMLFARRFCFLPFAAFVLCCI